MKRLALAVSTMLLGSGCIVSSNNPAPAVPTGAVDASWIFVRTKANTSTVSYSCGLAGIDTVGLDFSSGWSTQVACSNGGFDGATIGGVPAGAAQTVTVTGYRSGHALYASQFTGVDVPVGGATPLSASVYGLYDDLNVNALFRSYSGAYVSSWTTCAGSGVAKLTYSIQDYAGTYVAVGTVNCTDPYAPGVSFTGNAGLDRDTYTIRMQGFPSGSSVETFDSATTYFGSTSANYCSGQPFNHYGPNIGTGAWNVTLYDITGNSTLCI